MAEVGRETEFQERGFQGFKIAIGVYTLGTPQNDDVYISFWEKKKHILVINGMFEDDFPFGNRWDMFFFLEGKHFSHIFFG